MKTNIRNLIVAAAIAMVGLASPAFAGGVQVDNKSLIDLLQNKGVLSEGEAKAIKHNNDGKLKFEGLVFANTRFTEKTDQVGTTDRSQGLAIDRAYLTAKYSFNDDWMMRITTDVHLDGGLSKKNNNIFLKYAYVQGKLLGDAAVLRLGQSHTPWIDHEEHLWGHRYASPVFIDKHGFSASSDLGIGLKGKLANGLVKYWLTETDGAGYSHPGMHLDASTGTWKTGLPKAFDFDSRLGVYPIKGLTLDFQFRDGFKGTKYFDKTNKQTTPGTKHTLWQAMATYGMGHDWRVGANYVSEKSDRKVDGLNAITAQTDKTTGYAIWGWTKFPGTSFGAFGQYDYDRVKRTGSSINPKTNRYLLGLEYFPAKHIVLSLLYDFSKTTDHKFVRGDLAKNKTFGLFSEFKY
jgi:hypothetical protein